MTTRPYLMEAVAETPGQCVACGKPLPEKNRGRKAVRCPGDRECERYYHVLYDLGRGPHTKVLPSRGAEDTFSP